MSGPAEGARAELIEPETCRISGSAALDGSDSVVGDISGTALVGDGSWIHETPSGDVIELIPTDVTCRLNGVAIGDSHGLALVNGSTGYTYSLQVEDYDNHEPDVSQALVATRTYDPDSYTDGELVLPGDAGTITIPAELQVSGAASNGTARITFERAYDGREVTCVYRASNRGGGGGWGGGHHGNGGLCLGDSTYRLSHCSCERGAARTEAGTEVDVSSLTLHVDDGCSRCGTATVSVDMTAAHPAPVSADYYILQVSDDTGAVAYDQRGYVASGELAVESLD